MEELLKIDQNDFMLDLIPTLGEQHPEALKERLTHSLIELVKEKNQSVAALLVPTGMASFFKEESKKTPPPQKALFKEEFKSSIAKVELLQ
jgi:hypothetical protein